MDRAEPQSCAADTTTHPAPSRSICLKHLKNLTLLFERPVDMAFFLSHLEIPASAHIMAHADDNKVDPHCGILPCLPSNVSKLKPFTSMSHVSLSVFNCLILMADHAEGHANPLHCLSFAVSSTDYALAVRALCLQLGDLFQYCTIQTLELSVTPSHLQAITVNDWCQLFSSFSDLSQLRFDMQEDTHENSRPLELLLDILTWSQSPDIARPLPLLKCLRINHLSPTLATELESAITRLVSSRVTSFACDVLLAVPDPDDIVLVFLFSSAP